MIATLFFSSNYRRVQRGITSQVIHNILKLPVKAFGKDKLVVELNNCPKDQFESGLKHLMIADKDYGIETITYN